MMNRIVKFGLLVGLILGLVACGDDNKSKKVDPDTLISAQSEAVPVAELTEGSSTSVIPPSQKMKQVEGSQSEIEGHPEVDPNEKVNVRQVKVPSAVEGKWKAVKIMVRNKKDEEQSGMRTVDLGNSFSIDEAKLKVTVGPFLPNFVMDPSVYTSNGNELVNPAIRLVVEEDGKTIFEGWSFAKYPGMYAFEHETIAFQLMDFIPVDVS